MTPRADATTVLTLYVVLLMGLPSQLTFAPLGGAGSPARVLGLVCLAWWTYQHVRRTGPTSRQPVRIAYLVFGVAVLISYIFATTRTMPGSESNTALIALVLAASFGGSLLIACDGITSFERLTALQRRIVCGGAAMAALAIFQFATGEAVVDRLSIPGLTDNTAIGGVISREGMNRPSATAIHPIELGMALTMVLPMAFNLALVDVARSRLRRYAPVMLILFASILCISRSAIIGLTIGIIVVAVRWPPTARLAAAVVSPVVIVTLFLTVPGLLGTIGGMFTGAGGDSSVQSRTGSYAIAGEFIGRSPWFGRGFGTFLPMYRILDNQYLLLLIEIGIVGLVCFVALMVAGVRSAGRYRTHAPDAGQAQLAQGVLAAIVVGAGCMAFFDGLSFPIGSGLLFLLVGVAGAGARLATKADEQLPAEPRPMFSPVPLPTEQLTPAVVRRWYVAVAGLALTATAVVYVLHVPGVYWTQTEVLLLAPQSARYPNSINNTSSGVIATAGLVALDASHSVGQPATSSAGTSLTDVGVRVGESVRVPDTGGQWAHNFDRPVVDVEVVGPDAVTVGERAAALIDRVSDALEARQDNDRVSERSRITTSPSPGQIQTYFLIGEVKRAAAITLLLGLWLTVFAVAVVDAALERRRLAASARPTSSEAQT